MPDRSLDIAPGSGSGRPVLYHATHIEAVELIVKEGFRTWIEEYDRGWGWSRWPADGNLGTGIYVTTDWAAALMFGDILLQVETDPGTRLVDISVEPDGPVIKYLVREFGRDVLSKLPREVLPSNKRLTTRELIELARYHYRRAFPERRTEESRRSQEEQWQHARIIHSLRSEFVRHGIDGIGDPDSEMGYVVFAGERVRLVELVCQVSHDDRNRFESGTSGPLSLDELRERFWSTRGFGRARMLANRIARRRSG